MVIAAEYLNKDLVSCNALHVAIVMESTTQGGEKDMGACLLDAAAIWLDVTDWMSVSAQVALMHYT